MMTGIWHTDASGVVYALIKVYVKDVVWLRFRHELRRVGVIRHKRGEVWQ